MAGKNIENYRIIQELDELNPFFKEEYDRINGSLPININVLCSLKKRMYKPNPKLRNLIGGVVNKSKESNYIDQVAAHFARSPVSPALESFRLRSHYENHFERKRPNNDHYDSTLQEDTLYELTIKEAREYLLRLEQKGRKEFPDRKNVEANFDLVHLFFE